MQIGIVGLPNVGKSTLFNALLQKQAALAANYPFATIEPNIGIVAVPDERLNKLTELVKSEHQGKYAHKEVPEKIVPATIKFYDIAGLVKGAHKGEGLGNQFLAHIREVDAIVQVVRAFEDENVTKADSEDPLSDIDTINTELILADYQTMEKRIEKIHNDMKREKSTENMKKLKTYEKIVNSLDNGWLISENEYKDDELPYVRELNLLTAKPMIYVFNVSEDSVLEGNIDVQGTEDVHNKLYVCAKIESDLSTLDAQEKVSYMREMGIEESGLDKLIKKSYETLNLQTFFTSGPKEVHAWTIKVGTKAPQAAGKIHSDFERGFISADVLSYEDLVECKTWANAKQYGKLRLEGKEYVMQDGDVVEFRFGV